MDIKRIDSKTAQAVIIERHYLHRQAPCSFAFGVYNEDLLVGVIMYGSPVNRSLCAGVCGKEEQDNVIELTRLWLQDGLPKNTASWVIASTVKLVNKEIIVSYADPQAGHVGYVYQASNWIYTGLSAKRTEMQVKGFEGHSKTLFDIYKTVAAIKERFGDDARWVDRPRKHRYVYFNCGRLRRKALTKKLLYPILPYPKLTDF